MQQFWRRGDTLIEVTIALAILSMTLMASARLAIRAFQQAQTARQRTALSMTAQQQMEHLRSFRDTHSWSEFSNGNGSFSGVLSAHTAGTCHAAGCFTMKQDGSGFVPADGQTNSSTVPGSYVEIHAVAVSSQMVKFTVDWGFPDIAGGPNNTSHVVTQLTDLTAVVPTPSPAPSTTPTSPACPVNTDVVMVLDNSSSMYLNSWSPLPSRMAELKIVARDFVDNIALGTVNHVAIMSFNDSPSPGPQLLTGFTASTATAENAVTNIPPGRANTHYLTALDYAKNMFSMASARPTAKKVMVFISDGVPNDYGDSEYYMVQQAIDASIAKARTFQPDITIYTVGINLDFSYNQALDGIAGPAGVGTYAPATTPSQMAGIMSALAATAVCH